MEIIEVTDLEELHGKEWEYKGRKFNFVFINGSYSYDSYLKIFLHNFRTLKGDVYKKEMICVSEENLSELELFGIKVILKEEPKLTKSEREFLKIHEYIFIARDENGELWIYDAKPSFNLNDSMWKSNKTIVTEKLLINSETFKFITWESEKCWSKEELMKLEVIE